MNRLSFRLMAIVLLVALLIGTVPARETSPTKASETAQTRAYFDICKNIPEYEACNSMQGMAVLGDSIYTAKVNKENTLGTVFRTNRYDGTTTQMTIDGGLTADYFSHANDMCAAQVAGESYLFLTSMKTSVDALICFKISENALTLVGIFDVYTAGGSKITCSGLDVYEVKGNVVTLLVAQGTLVFKGTMDMTAPADLYCPLGFEIDKTAMLETARQACGNAELEMTVQGSGFYNDTYYMPLTLHHNHSTQIKPDNHADSTSVIVAFPNIRDAMAVMDRSVKASLSKSVYVPDAGEMFFEIESVDFADGILYFSTNRVRIDHSVTTVSLLLDEGKIPERIEIRTEGSGAFYPRYIFVRHCDRTYVPSKVTPVGVAEHAEHLMDFDTKFAIIGNEDMTKSVQDLSVFKAEAGVDIDLKLCDI